VPVARSRHTAIAVLLCAAPFMTVLDSNVVAIALPAIRSDLDFSRGGLQWVVGAYSLAFGGALLLAGRAADLYGRKRLLILGLASFSGASLAGALAPSAAALLAARTAQGLGAAVAFPASLALIAALYEPGAPRNRALGVYGAIVSAAFVTGMLAGGVLTSATGWRGTLLPGAVIGGAAALASMRLIPNPCVPCRRSRPALPGLVAAAAGMPVLLYGLGLSAQAGAPIAGPAAILCAAVLLGFALRFERRSASPLVPRGLPWRSGLASATAGAALTVGTGVGVMFVLSLYLQDLLRYGPVAAGLAMTPLGVSGVVGGLLAPRIARRAGLVPALAGALVVQAAGVALLTRMGVDAALPIVPIGTAAVGLGHFGATVMFTALATAGISDEDQGIAMGVISSAQQMGGAAGLAVLVAVATATTGSATAGAAANEAVVEGFRWALAAGAGLSLAAAVLVIALNERRDPAPRRRPRSESRTRRPRGRSSPR